MSQDALIPEQVGVVVEQLKTDADRLGLEWRLREGTIRSGTTASVTSVLVQLDGDAASTNGISLVGICAAGDRVMTLAIPPEGIYIVGFLNGPPLASQNSVHASADTQFTSSASNVDLLVGGTVLRFPFVKQRNSTRIAIDMHAGGYSDTSANSFVFAVRINGTDYDIARKTFLITFVYLETSGTRHISGIPAGSYNIDARYRRGGGAGNVLMDANIFVSIKAVEAPAIIS